MFPPQRPHSRTDTPHLPKPLFLQHFFEKAAPKQAFVAKKSRTIDSEKVAIFATVAMPNDNLQQTATKSANFVQTRTVAVMPTLLPNHCFYSAKRDVDYRLTRGWTIDWHWKRKKVDYRLTHQDIYIYIYINKKFGLFRGYFLGQVGVIIWAKVMFSPIFTVVSSDFCTLIYNFVFCLAFL